MERGFCMSLDTDTSNKNKENKDIITNTDLLRLHYLKKDIELQSQRLNELETIATSCTSRITGMPHGKSVNDKVGKYTVEIIHLKELIEKNLKKCFDELTRLTEFIQNTKDPLIRQVMTYRYIYGYSWQKTAVKLGTTSDSLRTMLHRHLNRLKK